MNLFVCSFNFPLFKGEYSESLQYLLNAGLDQLTEKQLPTRSLKMIAESYAVQALALEKLLQAGSSNNKQSEEMKQRLQKSMETAGDITLLYLQEQDKLQGRY